MTTIFWYFESDSERKNTGEWLKENDMMVNPNSSQKVAVALKKDLNVVFNLSIYLKLQAYVNIEQTVFPFPAFPLVS